MGSKKKLVVLLKFPVGASEAARDSVVRLIDRLRHGERLGLPHSRPMSTVGSDCHELRINDKERTWRVMYKIDLQAIVILDIFVKKSRKTTQLDLERARQRLKHYEEHIKPTLSSSGPSMSTRET